jgi:UDP-N-acetyl-D-mannosaminuronate dehydrogenase
LIESIGEASFDPVGDIHNNAAAGVYLEIWEARCAVSTNDVAEFADILLKRYPAVARALSIELAVAYANGRN